MFNYLIFSLFLVGSSYEKSEDPCRSVVVSIEVENDVGQTGKGSVKINVQGASLPIRYFFSNQEGYVVNTDFSKGSMELLTKGSYTCLVKEKGGCRKKIEFEIK